MKWIPANISPLPKVWFDSIRAKMSQANQRNPLQPTSPFETITPDSALQVQADHDILGWIVTTENIGPSRGAPSASFLAAAWTATPKPY